MGRKVLLLVAVTAVAAAVSAAAAERILGPGHWQPAGIAALLCVVPAAVTLAAGVWVATTAPDYLPAAVVTGTALRMAVVGGGVVVLGGAAAAAGIPEERLAGWAAFLYIVTLAAETTLLVRSAAGPRVG